MADGDEVEGRTGGERSRAMADGEKIDGDKIDRRRVAGERTRRRLIDASRALMAERGRSGVTLRAITDSADANVASVSYHFGSTEALLRATVEQALDTLAQAQIDGLRHLAHDASLAEIAAAWARPVIAAVSGPPSESQALIRIAARAATDPSGDFRERVFAVGTRADPDLLAALGRALPGVTADELRFRKECAVGILHFMASGAMRVDLQAAGADELEAMLIPALTGTLAGGPRP
jgi:AcrR family transcriptional regulator